MKKQLFAVYLWWKHENNFIEAHDLVFVIATDAIEAKTKAKEKTTIQADVHCDGIVAINNVDGYSIQIIQDWKTEDITYDNTYQTL